MDTSTTPGPLVARMRSPSVAVNIATCSSILVHMDSRTDIYRNEGTYAVDAHRAGVEPSVSISVSNQRTSPLGQDAGVGSSSTVGSPFGEPISQATQIPRTRSTASATTLVPNEPSDPVDFARGRIDGRTTCRKGVMGSESFTCAPVATSIDVMSQEIRWPRAPEQLASVLTAQQRCFHWPRLGGTPRESDSRELLALLPTLSRVRQGSVRSHRSTRPRS